MITDISYFNQVINWNLVSANVDGVIIRMGYSGYSSGKCVLDKKWREYSAAALKAGIPRGAYYFPASITPAEAKTEADFIYNEIKNVSLPLGLWLDSEIADVKTKNGRADHLTRIKRTELLKIIIDRLDSYGLKCGVYASESWLKNNLDMSLLPDVPVWCAQWGNKLTYTKNTVIWQYSNKGSIEGIAGRVDIDKIVQSEPEPIDEELDNAITVIAKRVIAGKFGVGHDNRMLRIYELIRQRVNDIM